MKTLYTLVLLLLVPVPLWAENAPAPVEPAAQETPAVGPIAAADVVLDELMSPVDAASPWSFRSPIPEWRRVTGVYSDVPQGLHTDEQAVQAWTRIWQGMVTMLLSSTITLSKRAWTVPIWLVTLMACAKSRSGQRPLSSSR